MRVNAFLAIAGSMHFGISGPFDCHIYALRGPGGTVLIDSGGGTHTDVILENLRADFGSAEVESLIVTHGHLDHCGGAAGVRARTRCKVIANELTSPILEKGDEEKSGLRLARQQGMYSRDFRFEACPVDTVVKDSEAFEAGGLKWKAIAVRGHSADSACYFVESDGKRNLFSADVVFYGGVLGLINAEGSELSGYRADLRKLGDLGVDGLFPGHGLFTVRGGQRHIDVAIEQLAKGFVSRQIGQGDLIF
jgi:hydroxyacylglutathione hydrolase